MTNKYYNPVNDGSVWPVTKAVSEANLSKVESGISKIDEILGVVHQGSLGGCILKNSGSYGFKMTPGTGLNVTVSPGNAIVGDKVHQLESPYTLETTARKAALAYALKQSTIGNLVPTFGVQNAAFPAQNGQLHRYTFSEETYPLDTGSAGNPITAMVDCARVDGHVDYAKQGNGTTSYMATGAAAGIALVNPRTERILYTPHDVSSTTIRYIKVYGNYHLYTTGARLKVQEQANVHDTGFDCSLNKTTYIVVKYDGSTLSVFAGYNTLTLVYTAAAVFNTTTGNLHFLRNSSAANYNNATIHYYDIVDYAVTDAEIYASANDFVIPTTYNGVGSNIIPVMTSNTAPAGVASASANDPDAYKAFDNDDGTSCAMAGATGQINYEHAVPKKVIAYGIKCINGATNPKNWTLQALDTDGSTWITLDTQVNIKWNIDRELIFYLDPASIYYKKYRLNITANNGGATTEIIQLNMYDNLIERSIVDDILPADSISLGFVSSGSTVINEIDDQSQRYKRIEYGKGGNGKVWLGWIAITANQEVPLLNPFGTEYITPSKIWYRKLLSDAKHSIIDVNSATTGGAGVAIKEVSKNSIILKSVNVSSVIHSNNSYTGASEASGFIGFWLEVIDDVV